MMKKLLSFICCLVPFGAHAATTTIEPGVNGLFPTENELNATTDSIVIQSNATASPDGIEVGTGGITVAGNMWVGKNGGGSSGGELFLAENTKPVFNMATQGNVSVGDTLDIAAGRSFTLSGVVASGGTANSYTAQFGSIVNNGILTLNDISALTVGTWSGDTWTVGTGAVTNNGTQMTINADSIKMGALSNEGGTLNVTAQNDIQMAQLQNNAVAGGIAGSATISGKNITVGGDIQNNVGGTMNINVAGDLTAAGAIENKGTQMTISAGDVSASTMTNEGGTLNLTLGSLSLTGGDNLNPSFINNGTFTATVTGETSFANDLYVEGSGSTFSLKTGTLAFGANNNILNDSNAFTLNVVGNGATQGVLQAGNISNGITNTAANLYLSGQSVIANSVLNNGGNLIIGKDATTGNDAVSPTSIVINGTVQGNRGITKIISGGALTTGDVTNSAEMVLNGNTVELANVTNNGAKMDITAYTDSTGGIDITGNVLNNSNGDMYINARDITIGGAVTNANSGQITIAGSDSAGDKMQMGALNVNSGVVNVNALAGGVSVTNGLNVTDGTLNIDGATHEFDVGGKIDIDGDVNVTDTAVTGAGNVNIAASGPQSFVMSSSYSPAAGDATGAIDIAGNIVAESASDTARSAAFVAQTIDVHKNVTAGNNGKLIFGDANTTKLTVDGAVTASGNGSVDIYADDTDVASLSGDGLFILRGSQVTANGADGINIANGLWFGPDSSVSNPIPEPTKGIVVKDTNNLTLNTVAGGADINVGGYLLVGGGKSLTMDSTNQVVVGGNIYSQGTLNIDANTVAKFENSVNNSGTMTVNAREIISGDIANTNSGKMTLTSDASIATGAITSSGDLTVNAGTTVNAGAIAVSGGATDITADSLDMTLMNVTGGTVTLNTTKVNATTNASGQGIYVAGDLAQGGTASGMLNLTQNNTVVTANNLLIGNETDNISGDLLVNANTVDYNIADSVKINGQIKVADGATANISANDITATADVDNAGTLVLNANQGTGNEINLGVVGNSGTLSLDSGDGIATIKGFSNTGTAQLNGRGMTLTALYPGASYALYLPGMLYQQYQGALSAGDVNVGAENYTITASNISVAGINQVNGEMVLNTADIDVGGDIVAKNLRIVANPSDMLKVHVGGNVSGGVDFTNLEYMNIDGNYTFNNDSKLFVKINNYNNTTLPQNYWARVETDENADFGKITNIATDDTAGALIQVGGKFTTDLNIFGSNNRNQVGIGLTQLVDQGTAIWLLHADGVRDDAGNLVAIEELQNKIRNLNVLVCNNSGTLCYSYFDNLIAEDSPAYLTSRDTDNDGIADSIYIVFDPRFGGPVEIFKIQPIVGREPDYTNGEYVSAGALDDMIAGQVADAGFYGRQAIEVIPVAFRGTNLEQMANELYNRMEYYTETREGQGLARFSRLFQVRELEQIAGAVSLNEHTNFRSFEDRMFDEFIWNRNRNLKKAWVDVDFGTFRQDVSDHKTVDGNRFSISGGYDWQESQTLILGLTGRVSHMSSDNSDSMNLGYTKKNPYIAGHVKTKVADTNIGLGGYLMKTLGDKTRVYGNAFLDMHWLDVSRDQNFVASIDGDGTAFSLISEWGLLHDWLNQYIVGNAYARVGYNFGFSVTEKAQNHDYMKLKSDGYLILTPGYSLTAQKRIYPSAWFQIRPYASIGVEYDVLGAPDQVKYKFAVANSFTDYDINIDPLWANIGGGVELLSATGIQVGLDYRYQYNADMQLHNIRVSGSYRF